MQIPRGKTDIPIAIIGMACRLPGADNLDAYWQLLASGGSAIAELPHERLDQSLYYDPRRGQRGKSYCKIGAIISSRQFDRQACAISKELESAVDNAHLLMCEVAAAACRHAGLDPFSLPLRNTGVYIGHAQGSDLAGEMAYGTCVEEAAQFLREAPDFQQLNAEQQEAILRELVEAIRAKTPQRRPDSPDLAINMVAGTISKAFGLNGPFMAVNSACASSLQTIQLAARALQLGRIEMAIVGGASDCKAGSLVLFSHAQSMSETGSRPFDAGADGLVCSEGYAALVLKTLPRALADGDPIQAIIPGLGSSSDGRGKSLWAPRKEGQVKAMERAYRNGLDMSTLQYIEAHATSTSLGDATELTALNEVLSGKFPPGKKIPIASVKANIGHALEAAGVASLIKTVLCMQHRTFAPAINIQSLNPKIDWKTAPFFIPRQLTPWPEQPNGSPRRAGVNAFGIGGLNTHVVLEEFTEDRRDAWKAVYGAASNTPQASHTSDSDDEAVAVIGMACVLPGANDVQKYWELIVSGRDAKCQAPRGRWRPDLACESGTQRPYRASTSLGGYITDFSYDWQKHKVPPKQVQQADPLQFMLLEAAGQALADAGYDKKEFDRTRAAVFVGTEFSSDFGTQLGLSLRLPHLELTLKELLAKRGVTIDQSSKIAAQFSDVLLEHWPALIDESGSFSSSTLASRITKTMNLMGGAAAIDAGDASSAAALAAGVDLLLSGDCDLMICAGGQRSMNLPQYEAMTQTGILASGDYPSSPFDASAMGIVPGEGVGVVVLKRLSDARRDGDRIRAIIRGIGSAHGKSAQESLSLAMQRSLAIAGVDAADVTVVEMDGTGLPEHDQAQLQAIVSVYGSSPRSEPLIVSSITGQIGHTIGASAMASFIKASLEVEQGEVPAACGLGAPIPMATQNASVLRLATTRLPIRHTTQDGRRLGAVSSFSKGLAFHILLERGEKVPVDKIIPMPTQQSKAPTSSPATTIASTCPGDWRIYRLGATTPAELNAKLQHALANVPSALAAIENIRFSTADRVRFAAVVNSGEMLAQKLQAVVKQGMNPAAIPVLEQQGCFYRQLSGQKPRIAFLFPGQGSQYAGMLRELVRDVPAAAETMRSLDDLMTRAGFQTFAQMAWENPSQLGTDIWVTQIATLLANLIVYAAVDSMGIKPDLVTGHSYGEFAALTAAGVWNFESVIRAARARYDGIEATPTARGTLMATTAPPQVIEQLAATLQDHASIANYNAPDQTVVGGRAQALKTLAALLDVLGHKSQELSVPCPFHTPLMQGAGAILEQTLESLPMGPPRLPFLSSVNNRYVAEPAEIRANLVAQLTTPVRYVDLVSRIATEQETVFVEVGPQQALTRLNRRILEGRSVAGMIGCDHPKRAGREQLLHVQALLECVGAVDVPTLAQRLNVSRSKGVVVHIDATERRRNKMRQTAQGSPKVETPQVVESAPSLNGDHEGNGAAKHVRALESVASEKPASANAAGLEKFLINFVVEQTGYPPEVVELDADLEADLGIDSIKKAQLFGELAEYFDVAPDENMTLDDFPTLRHVLNFLRGAPAKIDLTADAPTAAVPTPQMVTAASTVAVPMPDPARPVAELEKFLVNFVVEQTGYPPEVVELDADLEADLGIDSIKKAQLFGELAEYFDVQPDENLTLDDFPTLRHVKEFLEGAAFKKELMSQPLAEAVSTRPTAPIVVDPPSRPGGSLEAANGTAATLKETATTQDTAELERFLVNFVVEQTGYPPEVVELDADLEADLGIDSIKKAQLFGELSEYFDVQPNENLTLDDFPTLRHVVNFLVGEDLKKNDPPSQDDSAEPAIAPAEAPLHETLPATRLTSTSYQMGFEHGRQQKKAIRRILRRFADLDFEPDQWPIPGSSTENGNAHFTSDALDELQGIADAVQVPLNNIVALHRAIRSEPPSKRSRRTASADSTIEEDLLRATNGERSALSLIGNVGAEGRLEFQERTPEGASFDLGDEEGEASHRFVLATVPAPLDASVPDMPQWNGAALIVGSNPAADALRERLQAAGVIVRTLLIADDLDTTLTTFERLWNEQPLPHLFLMTARDQETTNPADEKAWNRRRYRTAILPYFLCQRWVQLAGERKLLDRSTLVAATALNGDFGFSSDVRAPEGGALTGLMKAIDIELAILRNLKTMIVKAIDSPDDEPPALLAANICRELASKAVDFEVAYVGGNRRLQYATAQPAPVQRFADIPPGGTWVLTGGARGITAACGLELGRRFGLKLHLIGTSPMPQVDPAWRDLSEDELRTFKTTVMREARDRGQSMDDAWNRVEKDLEIDRSLRAFTDAGVDVTYHSCDVADRNGLGRVLETIRRTSGPIQGIVHGAGLERSCNYERKKREIVMNTIAAKVDGALNLMRLTRQDPVQYFIGFGSVSGRLGSNGQTDYCLASDLLCKLAAWYRTWRPGVRAVGFHWHPWADVGMAAMPETLKMLRLTNGPVPMPKVEGIRHFLRELYAGAPVTEVLITDDDYYGRYYSTEHQPQSAGESRRTPSLADFVQPTSVAPVQHTWESLAYKSIASRHILKAMPAPLPPYSPTVPQFEGPVCILGDSPAAIALRDRLVAAGVSVQQLRFSTSLDEMMAAIETVYGSQAPRYLFVLQEGKIGTTDILEPSGWQHRRALNVVTPFLTLQHWFRLRRKAKDVTPITVVAVTSLGGDFGLSGQVQLPESGALTGLLKSLYVEDTRKSQREVRVKIIDTPADETPAAVVEALFRELAADDPNVEVSWSRGNRTILRSSVEAVESLPKHDIPRGGTWVITGGARGITAAAAFELGKRFGLKLHLIGRSPAPKRDAPWRGYTEEQLGEFKSQIVREAIAAGRSPERDWDRVKHDIEIFETLGKCAAAGIQATYHACDLADWTHLATVLDEIRRTDGPIEGIVHGAGYARPGRFDSLNRDNFERTIGGKLDGAVGLMSLTAQDPVRYWIGFGSISGRYGGNGLSDYAAANEMLAKLVVWYRARRPDCAACCIHWQSWDEIGMAMLADNSAVGTKGVLKMDFISPKEGVEHLCRELQAGLPRAEVIITDGFFERIFYPFVAANEFKDPSRLPLIETIKPLERNQGIVAEIELDPSADPFLFDHKLRDKPLLPAVVGLEALAEAATLCCGKPVVALRQVEFREGLSFHALRTITARVQAEPQGANVVDCQLLSDFQNRAGVVIQENRLHFRGLAEVADARSQLTVPMPTPPAAWHPFVFTNGGPMYHGPSLQGVKAVALNDRDGWGELIALPLHKLGGARAGHDWIVPATLIDAAFYVCGIHLWVTVEVPALPQSIESVQLGRMPKDHEKCLVYVECREVQARHAVYDFTVFGEDRSAIVQVQGYQCVMLKSSTESL